MAEREGALEEVEGLRGCVIGTCEEKISCKIKEAGNEWVDRRNLLGVKGIL